MKVFGQILAALLVTAVAAAATIEVRPEVPENEARRPCYGRRYYSGCLSIVGSLEPVEQDLKRVLMTDLEGPLIGTVPEVEPPLSRLDRFKLVPVNPDLPVNPYPTSLWRTDLERPLIEIVPEVEPPLSRLDRFMLLPSEGNMRTKRAEKAVATVLGRRWAKQRGEGTI